jgi:glucose/arabinose dehydrogenase
MIRTPLLLSALAAFGTEALAQQALTTVRVASGLNRPVTCCAAPGDNERLYVVEQKTADIKIIKNGVVQGTPFLDLTGLVRIAMNERGLLGIAFHPDYANNSLFYVNYTREPDGATVVVQYTAIDGDSADPSSAVMVLGPIPQPQSNHNGGHLAFGPDGKLYVGLGDGGNFNDQGTGHASTGNAQSGQTLLGKMLRLDVDIPAPHIPPDNPFVGDGDGILDEIWAFGLRNPWRYSFDSLTGDLYIADVGQDSREEVSLAPAGSGAGVNYGWRCMEGFGCSGLSGCTCNDSGLVLPIHQYNHSGGNCSITGGYVYRGCAIPDLRGHYFFADFCTGNIWSFRWSGTAVGGLTNRTAELLPPVGSIDTVASFGVDNDGEIYLCDFGPNFGANGEGEIYKIMPASNTGGLTYCTGKTNSLGCVPFLTASGYASATSPAPFHLTGNNLIPDQSGFFLYSVSGRNNLSFHGGTLCVKSPLIRWLQPVTPTTTGTPPCSGVLHRDFNTRIQSGVDPALSVGAQVNAQLRVRDPLDPAGFGDSLTDGVEFIICN